MNQIPLILAILGFAAIQVVATLLFLMAIRRFERHVDGAVREAAEEKARLDLELAEALQSHQRMSSRAKNAQEESVAAEIFFRRLEDAHGSFLRWAHRYEPRGVPLVVHFPVDGEPSGESIRDDEGDLEEPLR